MTLIDYLDRTERVLVTLLRVVLTLSLIAVLVVGTLMVLRMDASSRSQGGAVYVGLATLVLAGVIIGTLVSIRKQRKG
jgi:hypothetical protein